MRAAWYSRFGSAADVLEVGEVAKPVPQAGEVLVRVAVSGVNPVDVKRRQGGRGEMEAPRVVPHFDGAGRVESVGEGVETPRVGERVWFFEAQWGSPQGSAAEWVSLPASRAIALPEGVDYAAGACLGIPALTAHRAVFGDGSIEGATLLVTGGAGAVGRYAIQLARLGRARKVLTTVSSEEKGELALSAGADLAFVYRREDVAARIRDATGGAGVDRIVEVELGGNLDTALEVLKVNGVIAAYASQALPEPALRFYSFLYKSISLRHVLVFQVPEPAKQAGVEDLSRWLADGSLTHHVRSRFPLDRVVEAHEAVEAGALGKVVVELADA